MPEEGGLEVIRTVKKTKPEAKIIAISGFDLRQEVDVLELAKKIWRGRDVPETRTRPDPVRNHQLAAEQLT